MSKPAGDACQTCPLRDRKIVLPERAKSPQARLAIVGESPGRTEVMKKRPFVGASGQLLKSQLSRIGVRRGECHITNAVLCELRDKKTEFEPARKACAARLKAELEEVAAPHTITLGGPALHSTLPQSPAPSIMGTKNRPQWRGTIVHPDHTPPGSPSLPYSVVFPTLHPAFVLRSPSWQHLYDSDFDRVRRVMEEGWAPPEESRPSALVALDVSAVRGWLGSLLDASQPIGFDVETTYDGIFHNRLLCFALSDGTHSIVVPWARGWDGLQPWWDAEDLPVVQRLLNDFFARVTLVTHNGPQFDHIVAARHGLTVGEWADTMIASHVLESHLPRSLIRVATTYLDVGPWKQWEHSVDLEDLWTYNMRDTLYTQLSWQHLKERLTP